MPKILCLGDSITDCGRLFFHAPLGNGYVHMLADKLASSEKNWQFINCGVDGFTISRLLENVEKSYLSFQPEIVTILIGINDIGLMMNTRHTAIQQQEMMHAFLNKYETLLQRLQTQHPRIILMEPFIFCWPEEFQLWLPHVQTMSRGIANLASKYNLPYIPLQESLNQEAQKYGLDFVTTDGIHLTSHGHALIAEKLFQVLNTTYHIKHEDLK